MTLHMPCNWHTVIKKDFSKILSKAIAVFKTSIAFYHAAVIFYAVLIHTIFPAQEKLRLLIFRESVLCSVACKPFGKGRTFIKLTGF